jgi:hypothetical protein
MSQYELWRLNDYLTSMEPQSMPKKYEAIRDKMIAKGKSTSAAKTSAAKIYNATRKPGQAPVTRKSK